MLGDGEGGVEVVFLVVQYLVSRGCLFFSGVFGLMSCVVFWPVLVPFSAISIVVACSPSEMVSSKWCTSRVCVCIVVTRE